MTKPTLVWRVQEVGWQEAEWGQIYMVHHVGGHVDDERVDSMLTNLEQFSTEHSQVHLAVVTGRDVRPPSSQARSRVIKTLKKNRSAIPSAALWTPAKGMVASAVRSVATAIFSFGTPWLDSNIFSERASFVAWATRTSEHSSADVKAMLKELLEDREPT